MKPKAIEHPDFGRLVWDEQFERYSVTVGEGDEAFLKSGLTSQIANVSKPCCKRLLHFGV